VVLNKNVLLLLEIKITLGLIIIMVVQQKINGLEPDVINLAKEITEINLMIQNFWI
jgi:hypothetical protein